MENSFHWLVWFRRLLVLLAGLAGGLVLFAAGALLLLDDAQYRRVCVWSADHFLDSELVIDGPFTLHFGEGIKLAAGDVSMQAHDGSYTLQARSFQAHFALRPLLSGVFLMDDLSVSGFFLRINEAEGDTGNDLGGFNLPYIFLGRARVDNLVVEYQEAKPGTLHRFTLEQMTVGEGNGSGRTITANGMFEEHAYTIHGIFPPFAEVLDSTRVKHVELTLDSETICAEIAGTIMDLVSGAGMDLQVHANLTGVQELLEVFDDGIPALGDLEASARVRGDYRDPRLDDIDLRLQREGTLKVTIGGEIANALTGEGMNLQVDGTSDNPAVLSYLLFRREDRLDTLRVQGRVRKQQQAYYLDDLDAEAVTREGLNVSVAGSGRLYGHGHVIVKQDAAFTAKLHAPRTAALNLLGIGTLPELGPVSGSARAALGITDIGLYASDIKAGTAGTGTIRLTGDIGHVPLKQGAAVDWLAMQVDVRVPSLTRLGRQFGLEWPELGAMRLSGDLDIQGERIVLDKARLAIGKPAQPAVRATGKASWQQRKGSSIDINFDVSAADLLAAYSAMKPADLGRLTGSARVADIGGSWGVDRINLVSQQTRLFNLKLDGVYGNLKDLVQIDLNTDLRITDPTAFITALGLKAIDIKGPYHAIGRLTGSKETIRYRGNTELGQSTGVTDISLTLSGGKPQISGKLDVPVLYLADLGLDVDALPDIEGSGKKHVKNQPVFSHKPLDVGFLDSFNLDLAFRTEQIKSRELTIRSVDARVRVKDGRLSIDPLKLVFEGGDSISRVSVADGTPPVYGLKMVADNVRLGPLLTQVQAGSSLNGYINIDLDLTASGRSAHEIAAGLNGTVDIGLENVRVPKRYLELLSVDLFGWAVSKTFERENYTDINCVVLGFDVKDGRMNSKVIAAESPRMSLSGRIDLDLGAETMDVVIIPKQKKRIFSSATPVKLQGPLRDPKVTAIPVKAAIKEVGGLALLPAVMIPVTVIGELWSIMADNSASGTGCNGIKTTRGAVEVKHPKKDATH